MTDAYTLPDWELLLKAVAASPDDDLPRLVAADWLEEHGEADRAEFIRTQIERAKADRPELEWREQGLWNNPVCGPLWAVEACPNIVAINFGSTVRDIDLSGSEHVTFRRGFPFRITCTADEWLRHGKGIVPRQPVREVALSKCDELEAARWWEMIDTLRPLVRLEIDSASVILATFLRDRICPGVLVCNPDGPVEDEVVSRVVGRWESRRGPRSAHISRPPREQTLPPQNDTAN